MATINRFNQLQEPAKFSPLSFQEIAYAPTILRQREDAIINKRDELLNDLYNIEVPQMYQEQFEAERGKIENDLNSLAKEIQTKGAGDLSLINQFRNLRNSYNKSISNSGNIGRAANLNTHLEEMKSAYFEDALAKGQPAESVNLNWDKELDNFLKGLPSDLSKYSGQLPDMSPNYAPDYTDLATEGARIAQFLKGMDSEELGDYQIIGKDANGNTISEDNPGTPAFWVVETSRGANATNNGQVKNFQEYLNAELLNEDSLLHRNLNYRNIDPEEYLQNIENLGAMLTTKKTSDITTGQVISAGGRSGGRAKNSQTPKPTNKASLRARGSGQEFIPNSKSSGDIKKELNKLYEVENNSEDLSPDEIKANNVRKTQLQHALLKRQKLEKDNNFVSSVNQTIQSFDKGIKTEHGAFNNKIDPNAKNIKQNLGINDLDSYNKVIENEYEVPSILFTAALNEEYPDKDNYYRKAIYNKVMSNISDMGYSNINDFVADGNSVALLGGGGGRLFNRRFQSKMDNWNSLKDEVNKQYETSPTLYEDSTFYEFGINTASTKVKDNVNSALRNIDLQAALSDGILSMTANDGENTKFLDSKSISNSEENSLLIENLENAAESDLIYEMQGLFDGGTTKDASLMFKVFKKKGAINEFQADLAISIDENSNIFKDFFNPNSEFYQSMDQESQTVLDSIVDRIKYSDVATDLYTKAEMFTPEDNSNIRQHAVNTLSSLGITNANNPDGAIHNYRFINNSNNVAIVLQDDESYKLVRENDEYGNSTIETFKFSDYINTQKAIDYTQFSLANNMLTLDGIASENGTQEEIDNANAAMNLIEMRSAANLIYELAQSVSDFNINSVEDISKNNPSLTMYAKDLQFIQALREANHFLSKFSPYDQFENSPKNQELVEGLYSIYAKIQDMEVNSTQIRNLMR